MPRPSRRVARAATRLLVVPLGAALLWAAAPAASAHTDLTSGTPAEGATLDALPADIRLTFSDEMTQEYAKVALTGPDGSPAAAGDPQVSGRTASLPVKPGLPSGTYTVGYRVVSADGHPVSGSYTFTLRAAAPSPAAPAGPASPSAGPTADSPSAGPASTDGAGAVASSGGYGTVAALGAVIVAGAGAAVFVGRRRRARRDG
ncbi:hypothetical protein BCL76_11388 [Streptomyces sp. CG 926]|uniref:copper resistance CopC family protein n=1 Tax=Streptomyces sp. CG 926 TaxID=1882405 RepID=UPI000D6DBDDD|nr:copper resistance CopC family protein [Streptomyces sp. CG 926]PWK65101.1 hypothetical protein BCL76_11388 [Streptomyces sp. CG 926]